MFDILLNVYQNSVSNKNKKVILCAESYQNRITGTKKALFKGLF
jgi:hypothetical protein